MSHNLPKISIITPVKNGVKTLEKAIQSLLAQNYPNLEYIVIDGASTDGTLEIIKKYRSDIAYFESADDRSNVIAYIKGINKATGSIISCLNSDDFYEPGILHKVGMEFEDDPKLDILSFRYRTLTNTESGSRIIDESTAADMELSKEKMFSAPAPNTRFFKKEIFIKCGMPIPHDDQNRTFISNDLEYMIRFVLSGVKNKTLDFVGYNYLIHDNSLTFSKDLKTQKRLCEDKIFIAKKFLNDGEPLPKFYEKAFKKWIKKYRAKIAVLNLKEKNWAELRENLDKGIKENGLIGFLFYLLKSLIRS